MLTGSWRLAFPSRTRLPNLGRIAQLLKPFDIVGLQEVDGGGLRSQNIIQTQYLGEHAGFPYWHNQVNRRIANLARHSNGLLSRLKPAEIHDYKLPGLPGRGALLARYGTDRSSSLHVCVVHLALTRRARLRQLGFLGELLQDFSHVVVMGDFNCQPDSPEIRLLATKAGLSDPARDLRTWPSWQPRLMIDHILVTPNLTTENARVLNFPCSDHLPVALEIRLPDDLHLHQPALPFT